MTQTEKNVNLLNFSEFCLKKTYFWPVLAIEKSLCNVTINVAAFSCSLRRSKVAAVAAAGCGGNTLRGAHSANFDEKVHKPQSKLYGIIGANMQLFLYISYGFEYFY